MIIILSSANAFRPLPDDKITGFHKLKAFADNKLNITQKVTVVCHRIENIVGKEENAGYQHFLLFTQCFSKGFLLQCIRSRHCVVKGLFSPVQKFVIRHFYFQLRVMEETKVCRGGPYL